MANTDIELSERQLELRAEYTQHRNKKCDDLFNYIARAIKSKKAPPTYDDMAEAMQCSKALIARRIKELCGQGRLVTNPASRRSVRIARGQGHDDIADIPYLTEDRKAILASVDKLTRRNGKPPSVNAIAHITGFSARKVRRQVEYLEEVELLRYSPLFEEVTATKPSDYVGNGTGN